ncbi:MULTISPECIES: NAD(P)/FAD-dependent oxidoreductase [Amycolatopsis]|uniref:Pyridine nucleotide-disulphide oxidoreductase n=2 Tax=Amycolatopsis TaxID=1813 RepID=A0A1I4D9I4_9PSEU|nr:FAD/NAD(P)-binding oxidoreductase [Amycolatopsis sacchari]SFK90258.1 Pyridine nucleotide-disulphide oxidoreductase [Amycolatopsis sacchari]
MRGDDRFVLVGGGPAAYAAAQAYREAGGGGEVVLLSADTEPPYERPPLSKEFLRGEAGEDELPLAPPHFYRDHGIEVVLDDAVVGLDTAGHVVHTASGREFPYHHCLLATGAQPARPRIPGAVHPNVRTLRSAADGRALRKAAESARSAVIAGAGFIGCEAAISLSRMGVQVTLLCPDELPQQRRLGPTVGRKLLHWLKCEGVSVLTGTRLLGVDDGYRVRTEPVPLLDTDLVLLATGVAPRAELARQAGISTTEGRICADERMRTSAPGVLAAGDVALAYHAAARRPLPVEHWDDALTMGQIAGRTAAGAEATWTQPPGFRSLLGERSLKYVAWGDGFDHAELVQHEGEAFTVWYTRKEVVVGVLTHDADDDHERGTALVQAGLPLPAQQ